VRVRGRPTLLGVLATYCMSDHLTPDSFIGCVAVLDRLLTSLVRSRQTESDAMRRGGSADLGQSTPGPRHGDQRTKQEPVRAVAGGGGPSPWKLCLRLRAGLAPPPSRSTTFHQGGRRFALPPEPHWDQRRAPATWHPPAPRAILGRCGIRCLFTCDAQAAGG